MAAIYLLFLLTVGNPTRPGVTPTSTAAKQTSTQPANATTSVGTPTSPIAQTLDLTEKALKILAYIVGAGWVYFNYFRGRTYRPRLEPHVTAELCRRSIPEFIRAFVTLKNVGLSRVLIRQDGTGLRFFIFDPSAPESWRKLTTMPVFERHQWIEPGETIEDHVLLSFDLACVAAVRLHLVVGSTETMWNAITIAT
jgi:hypothetical protein